MRDIIAGFDWAEIPGLSYRGPTMGDPIIHNADRDFIANLDALPFPSRESRQQRGYVYKNNLLIDREYDQMEFGRGCHGQCTFCCETLHVSW